MYNKTTLDNGIRVITYNMPEMNSVSFGIWINAGSRNEAAGQKGIAHLLEHMVFKGSRNYSGRRIKESLEGAGGALNASTSEELTCYFVKIPAEFQRLAVQIISDMTLYPLIEEAELAKEKGVIIEEIKMYRDLPQVFVYDLMDSLLWPEHPLGINVAGTEETVAAINRQQLFAFRDKFYDPANIVITAAGRVSHDLLLKELNGIFKAVKKQEAAGCLEFKGRQEKIQVKIMDKPTEQSHLVIGFHGLSRGDPKRYKLSLLNIILGGNMSSRLFNEVREDRGLAYEIGSAVKRFKDTGAFLVHAGIDNKKVTEAIEVILKQIYGIKNGLVSDDELKRAKDFYIGQLKMALEDTLDHMVWLGEPEVTMGRTFTPEEVYEEVSRINAADLRGVAGDIFVKDGLNIALIGPLKSREKEISGCAERTGS